MVIRQGEPEHSREAASARGRRGPVATTAAQSVELGREAQDRVPVEALGEFRPDSGRDPVGLLVEQDAARVPELVPLRHGRMAVSPFTFYRGAASPMAADLAGMPSPGLWTQLCGDAHLSNFGAYASPERRLVFDVNDFDETLPGPFEWDLARLVASTAVAGRSTGFSAKERRRVARATARAYAEAMTRFASRPFLDVWYSRFDVADALEGIKKELSREHRKKAKAQLAKARSRDGLQAVRKLTVVTDGRRRIVSDPPLVVPIEELIDQQDPEETYAFLRQLLARYHQSLSPDRRHLFREFTLAHVARKVVGVGSVGTRAWIILLESRDGMTPLLLQAKQAGRSVLADHLGESAFGNQGRRVVEGQRMMQAASDVLLGWNRTPGPGAGSPAHVDYYVRQLRDWKYGVDIELLSPWAMATYGRLCAWTLARAHARTGDRIAIATYLGRPRELEHAMATFAETYADQTERDHRAHSEAISGGRVRARADG